jgi:nucleotide-binding universal stress UspA family protein
MAQWNKILVGVDGSPASRKALEWAGDEAIRHKSELVLLTAYLAPPPPPSSGGISPTVSPHEATGASEAASKTARQLLMGAIQDVLGEDPPVVVHPRVMKGNAAKLLIDLSGEADLVVVGSRGHGGFAGLLLGSVSQNVAAYARCTVVVVR